MTKPLMTAPLDWTLLLPALCLLGLLVWAYRYWRRVRANLGSPPGYRSRVGLPMWKRRP